MEPVTVSSKALRAAFKALESQVEDVRVVPEEDGWHIYGLAVHRSSMVSIVISEEAFEAYDQWKPFAVRAADVLDVLSRAGAAVTVEDLGGRLRYTTGRFSFIRSCLADFEQHPRVPKGEQTCEVALSSDILADAVGCVSEKEAKSRAMTLRQTKDALVVTSAEENDPETVTMTVPRADADIMDGEAEATYSHRLMREIVSAMPKAATVDMQFGDNNILKMSYTVDHADILFILAPWVEKEQD